MQSLEVGAAIAQLRLRLTDVPAKDTKGCIKSSHALLISAPYHFLYSPVVYRLV